MRGRGIIALVVPVLLGWAASGCADAVGHVHARHARHADGRHGAAADAGLLGGRRRTHPTGGFEYELALELADRFGLDRVRVRDGAVLGDRRGRPRRRRPRALADHADRASATRCSTSRRPTSTPPPAFVVRAGTEVPDVQTAQEPALAVGATTTFEHDRRRRRSARPAAAAVRGPRRRARGGARRRRRRGALRPARRRGDRARRPAPRRRGQAARRPEPIAAALPDGSDNTEAVSSALRAMQRRRHARPALRERWLGVSISDERRRPSRC